MSIHVEARAEIPVSAERAYAALTDIGHAASWQPDVVRLDPVTEGPLRLGSRWVVVRVEGGRQIRDEVEVIAFHPPTLLGVVEHRSSAMRGECVRLYRLVPRDGGVMVEMSGEIFGLTGVRKVLGRSAASVMRGDWTRSLRALREHLTAPPEGRS